MTQAMDQYKLAKGAEPLRRLVDDLSNWYVRRSRRRFWKSDSDTDKAQAYLTLHYVMLRISQLLAPFAPFVSDTLWHGLTEGMNVPESVHLSDWPVVAKPDSDVLQQMELARQAVTMALSDRAAAGIKVRQPLSELKVLAPVELDADFVAVIAEEVNVKVVSQGRSDQLVVELNKEITQELADEGAVRDLIRHIQSKRKEAGLEVADRIQLSLGLDSADLQRAIKAHTDLIKSETLATKLTVDAASDAVPVKVNAESVTVDIVKA
jgi:isoleucyl-tRNA synthetase